MRKQFIFIALSMLLGFSLFSQPFIVTEKQWNVRLTGFGFGFSTEIFKIEGDTTINSLEYNKIRVSYDSLVNWIFMGLLRESENVVYYIPPNSTEGILYDFNLQVGDSAYVRNFFCNDTEVPIYVAEIDTVEYFGVSRKRWHIENNGYIGDYWTEGIGSLSGPLYSYYSYCIICPVWELLCYHESENLLYIKPGENECYQSSVGIEKINTESDIIINPNPVRRGGEIMIDMPTNPLSIGIYNSSGALIKKVTTFNDKIILIETHNFSPGFYFLRIEISVGKILNYKVLVE